ncbi:DUF6226 family protein [Arthrobacter rhombi]|uniref:DUF6226 family protein n=1 Tax=Arthrobacter rhombi TaxID=71253 RepID=UPI003FD0C88E
MADALIDWLLVTFDAVAERDPGVATDLLLPPADIVRAVRVVPSNSLAAPLTFVFTGFPGIFLHPGALYDSHYPVCGCDACDEDVPDLLENLESMVRVVVSGGYLKGWIPAMNRRSTTVWPSRGVGRKPSASMPRNCPRERWSSHESFSRPTDTGCPGRRRCGTQLVPAATDKPGIRGAPSTYGS